MILMTLVIVIAAVFLGMTVTSCSSGDDDDQSEVYEVSMLYAIVKPEEAQLIDITPQDYVLTLDNIIAVNPETGEFKLRNAQQIDAVAFPIPTQYVIQFYNEGSFLFEAKLNSIISSYLPSGLTFCHFLSDKNGLARYDLSAIRLISQDGKVNGNPTSLQEQGVQRLYQILEKTGKISRNIDYDFQFNPSDNGHPTSGGASPSAA